MRGIVAGASVMLGFLLAAASATAGPYTVTGPTQVPDHPFAAGCGGPGEAFHTASEPVPVNFADTEVEPWFEVNPQDASDLAGFWQQDRWTDGGAHGLVAGISQDGGLSWVNTWPAFSTCTGGTAANGGGYERSSDPWLSWSPFLANGSAAPVGGTGVLHAISISTDRSTAHNAVLASRSLDGGLTWSPPAVLREDNSNSGPLANLFNDKESITADPTRPNAYAVWDRIESPNNNPLTPPQAYANALAFRGPTWFARSTDNGATWETARRIFAPQASRTQTLGNQIVVLPDGTLIDGFGYFKFNNGRGIAAGESVAVIRSADQGTTWSPATIVAPLRSAGNLDPEPIHCLGDPTPSTPCQLIRTGDVIPDFAVDPRAGSETVYAVWQAHETATTSLGPVDDTIYVKRSTDGGETWPGAPVKVNKTPAGAQAFTASVHVAANGDVAVTYYDFRNFHSGDARLSTDYWIVHYHAGDPFDSAHFGNEARLTPASFDMRTAPYARGYFVGDYEGLDNIGNGFTPFFVQADGTDSFHPLSDPFYSTAMP
jgi:hypothetical protein